MNIENEINDVVRRRTSMRHNLYDIINNAVSTVVWDAVWNTLDVSIDDAVWQAMRNTLYEDRISNDN